jgi:hypothetical protein
VRDFIHLFNPSKSLSLFTNLDEMAAGGVAKPGSGGAVLLALGAAAR